jgi:hypothetical protein
MQRGDQQHRRGMVRTASDQSQSPAATRCSCFSTNCYLPIDKHDADLLFQIISHRYERAPTVITTNRVYMRWAQIFNNDSTLASAILDRVAYHVETLVIEGKSYRMKDDVVT